MYQKLKLNNGLKLILAPLKETKAVTVLVLLPVGSRYETQSINGTSHFIEHMMFKGTKRRPTSLEITKELDAVGAEYNAFTGKDHTGYYIKTAAEEIELAFDILSDMLFNSTFALQELDKERGVITEEINMYQDNPMIYIQALFEQTIFGNHPLGWLISGPKEIVKKISRNQILDYKNKFYQPANMLITVAGNFNQTKVNFLAKKYFGLKTKKLAKSNFSKIIVQQTQPRINSMFKETKQVQIGLGVPAYSLSDSRIYPLYLLAVVLGGNMSSRLFTVVREQYGLAYYIKADLAAYQDTGYLVVQAGLDKRRIKQALGLILAELRKIKDYGITDKELDDAQEFLKGKLVLELEDSENVADWYSKQELLLGKIYTPEQKLKKIFAVKKEEVKKTAQQLIKEPSLNLALIGPFKDKKRFRKLLKLE